jgi:hypothetical protein
MLQARCYKFYLPRRNGIVILVLRASLGACLPRSFRASPDAVVVSSFRPGCLLSMEIPASREAILSQRHRHLVTVLHVPYFAGPWVPWSVDWRLQRHVHLETQ